MMPAERKDALTWVNAFPGRMAHQGARRASRQNPEGASMVGITLTAEQIRAAPPEVRHWIESQVAAVFASPAAAEGAHAAPPHLAQVTAGEAQAILEQIEDLLPVVSVFFELGRENASVPVQGMRAFRLARHPAAHAA